MLIEEVYARLKLANHLNLLLNSIKVAYGEQLMMETDASPTVEIELQKQQVSNRLLIHLLEFPPKK